MTSPGGAEATSILTRVPFPSARFEVRRAKQTSEESFGERVARLRREKGLTQEDLAERLDVTQPVVSDYERGRLRLHGELIVQLAAILGVSADEILGLKASGRASRAIKNRRLLRQVQQLEKLPKRDQQALLRTIDAFLSKAG
jgi:transcriptional regulator with XRE-family HTH domain